MYQVLFLFVYDGVIILVMTVRINHRNQPPGPICRAWYAWMGEDCSFLVAFAAAPRSSRPPSALITWLLPLAVALAMIVMMASGSGGGGPLDDVLFDESRKHVNPFIGKKRDGDGGSSVFFTVASANTSITTKKAGSAFLVNVGSQGGISCTTTSATRRRLLLDTCRSSAENRFGSGELGSDGGGGGDGSSSAVVRFGVFRAGIVIGSSSSSSALLSMLCGKADKKRATRKGKEATERGNDEEEEQT